MRAKRKPKDEIGFTARTLLSPIERIEPLTYRIDDAAFVLGVSTRKVWRLIQGRKIPCRKIEGSAVIAVDDLPRTARPKVPATSPTPNHMPTSFLLLAQYGGRAMITVDEVCRDFFAHLTPAKLIRKTVTGEITLPVVRMDGSMKAARAVHLSDLADYLDGRRAAAKKELVQITGRPFDHA